MGMGSGVVDTDLSHAHLQSECRPGGRGDGTRALGRRHLGDGRCGLADGAALHGQSPPRPVDAWGDHWIRNYSFLLCLLDAYIVGGEAHVLDLYSRDLLLHRTLHGAGAEPRAE